MDIYNATLIGSIMTLAVVITISLAVNNIEHAKPLWPDLSLLVIIKFYSHFFLFHTFSNNFIILVCI